MMNFSSISKRWSVLVISSCFFILTSCEPIKMPVSNPQDNPPAGGQQLTCPETSLPWNTEYLLSDLQSAIDQINVILEDTGLVGQGETIISLSKQYGINPAFALSMFRKEASFATFGSRAYHNNNPGNINATGNCRGLSENQSCNGFYGEISTDGRFGKYQTMADGIKAYYILLSSEYKPGTKRNCTDITCVISAYAPSSENDTASYIKQVTNWTQEYECQILGVTKPAVLAPASTQPSISVTVVSATLMPTQDEDIQFGCSSKSLSPEEIANCGTHTYIRLSCETIFGNCECGDNSSKTTNVTDTIFGDDDVNIWANTYHKISYNTYQGKVEVGIGTFTFTQDGFNYSSLRSDCKLQMEFIFAEE